MIIKSFELQKIKSSNSSIILIYGNNEGLKEQIINDCFIKDFKGEILNYDEIDVLNNKEEFISNLLNRSLFEDNKAIIISRATEKLIDTITDIIEKNPPGIKIIIKTQNLEKKSEMRNLFEKDKNLICIPVYEDDTRILASIVQNFLTKNELKLSQEIINILIERSKGDRKNLNNELSKLKSLAISKKKNRFI